MIKRLINFLATIYLKGQETGKEKRQFLVISDGEGKKLAEIKNMTTDITEIAIFQEFKYTKDPSLIFRLAPEIQLETKLIPDLLASFLTSKF